MLYKIRDIVPKLVDHPNVPVKELLDFYDDNIKIPIN